MKQIILFITAVCAAPAVFGQVFQNFQSISSLKSLTNSCWEFQDASLTISSSGDASLALTPPTAGSAAWTKSAYINLNTSSHINFIYQQPAFNSGNTETMKVSLQKADGTMTLVKSVTLQNSSVAAASTFTAVSPLSGTYKLVIEVIAPNNDLSAVYIDDISVDGIYNYTTPYRCNNQAGNAASIHYLTNFSGILQSNKIQLQWTVAENDNNKYFEIERSTDGVNFKNCGIVWASSTVTEETYAWSDLMQGNSYYRLKIINKTNVPLYSNVLAFKNKTGSASGITLMQNPVQSFLHFSFTSESSNTSVLTVYDLSGLPVFKTTLPAAKGHNVFVTPINQPLKKGLYLMEIISGSSRSSARLIKE